MQKFIILMACYVTVTAQDLTQPSQAPTQNSEVKGYYTANPFTNSAVKVLEPIVPRLIQVLDDEPIDSQPLERIEREKAAVVGAPDVVAAFPVQQEEPDQDQDGTEPTEMEPCRYTFTIPKSSHCEIPVFEPQKLNADIEQLAFTRHQRNWIERHRPRIVQLGRVDDTQTKDESIDLLSEAYESLTGSLKVQLENLEREIRSAASARKALALENRNLGLQLQEKQTTIDNLSIRYMDLENDMAAAENNNLDLLNWKNQAIQQQNSLEYSKVVLTEKVDSLMGEKKRLVDHVKVYRMQSYNLSQDKLAQQERLNNMTNRMRRIERLLRAANSKTQRKSCGRRIKEETNFNYTHCGKLVNISGPVPIRRSGSTVMGRQGVWMKDPLSALGDNKVWSVSTIGKRIRRIRQYADLNLFSQHKHERNIMLQVPMESTTGAVVYNGSLYYQRRNSRRIVRFDLSKQTTLKQLPLSKAGYHATYAYVWGGFSDIDFAVDESGLWVIYSTQENRGNIVVAKLNPVTLQPTRIIKTPIDKRAAANAFIICGTLYTVNSHDQVRALIKFSYNLNTEQLSKIDIPFVNRYRYNVMIDYNPRDRYIYAWDNSHQIRYKVQLDSSYGPVNDVINTYNSDVTS